ncbi:MAG: isochorismate synthase [Haloferacaceae archaeon]
MSAPRAGGRARLVSRSVRIPDVDPRAVLRAADAPRTAWAPPDGTTVVAGGAAATIEASGVDRFDAVRAAAADLLDGGDVHAGTEAACPRLFGGFAFHADGSSGEPWDAFPAARFVLPRVQVTETRDGTWLTVTAVGADATSDAVEARVDRERDRIAGLSDPGPGTDRPGVRARRRTTDRATWTESVEDATHRVRAGDLRKVVLAQGLAVDLARPVSVADLLGRLGAAYPDCYRFLVEPDDEPTPAFLGATPERLVRLHGRTVSTGALAGTTGRGDTPAEDEWLAEELAADEKNGREHDLVVGAVRDQLSPFGRVRVGERTVRRLATIQHLHTPISATLSRDAHVLDLVEALHPTPAVGGLPPDRALATIRETEPFDRGWYAAPVGWFDAAGNGEFAVAIRSAVVAPDRRRVTAFAGVGLVADSDPDEEWDEVQLKYRPILDELESRDE